MAMGKSFLLLFTVIGTAGIIAAASFSEGQNTGSYSVSQQQERSPAEFFHMIGMSEYQSYDLKYLTPCEPECQHLYDTITIIHDQDMSGEYYAAAVQDTKYPFHA